MLPITTGESGYDCILRKNSMSEKLYWMIT
jgi:hypothetical protein